ncbi:P-loop NTPase fold protein [Draconibacterium orientale]|uniref:KAP family P-loop NTPase fold protein n=1 Tax=Draconibacterium orientale TaxID=1168034 RepID=UPI002A0A5B9E|nr:P-loop NTPase fold protein [Draconibacterium orientale]
MRTDSPIRKPEDDLLGRYSFAEDIVSGLLKTFKTGQASVAIGLNGEWGAGKSSILEFISTEISNQTREQITSNIVFRFNPWLFSGQSDLQKSFLTQLGIHLRTINPELKKLGEDITLLSAIIEIANVFNPDIISRKFIGGGSKIVQKIANKITNEPSLQKLKERIDLVLESSSIKVFVIIDDIDRLIPSEIANIFRLVNLNANFRNTFFFLAYDKNVVSKAIGTEFNVDGEQFIEKIIQLDYSIPKLTPETLEDLFKENFAILLSSLNQEYSKKELEQIWSNGLSEYFSNLRHIYRYFNALEIRYPAIKDNVNVIDFAVIEAIRLFDYSAFEWIFKNKESLVAKVQPLAPIGIDFEKKPSILEILDSTVNVITRTNTKSIINSIFNSIHFPVFNFGDNEIDIKKLEQEKRIAHKDYFEHYFSFKISPSLVPEGLIIKFINSNDENRDEIIDENLEKKLDTFLKQLFYNLPKEKTAEIQKYILDYSDRKSLQLLKDDKYGYDGLFMVVSFLNRVADRFGFDEYFKQILSETTSYSRFYLQGFLRNRVLKSNNIEPVRNFPEELIEAHKGEIKETFKQSLYYHADKYLANPYEYNIQIIDNIFRVLHEEDKEVYNKKIEEYLGSVNTTLILLRCSFTYLHGIGGESYSIQNDKYILPELTIEKFDSVLGNIKLEEYEGEDKEFLAVFLKLKEKEFNPYYHFTIDLKQIEF